MKNSRKLFFLAPCVLLLTAAAHGQTDAPKIYQHEAFQLRVPSNVSVVKKEVADFDSISITRDKTRLMGIYVGGHPSFPSDDAPTDKSPTHFKLRGLDAKFTRWQDEKGRYSGETLVSIRQGWADVIHFYYDDLSQSDAAQCEAIIRSVTINPKQARSKDKETWVPVN